MQTRDRKSCPAAWAALLGVAVLSAGCSGGAPWWQDPADYAKPTVAVMKFENKVSAPMGWNISQGLPDMLTDSLVATNRYHVVERPEVKAVVQELKIQKSGLTREQNKAQAGRIMNAQYLIKGVVTDFGHISGGKGWLGGGTWDFTGGGTRAVMGMTIYVVDVESGEIVSSKSIEESVATSDAKLDSQYKGIGFGGQGFYRTPLGRATRSGIDDAVRFITAAIASRPWEAKIAQVTDAATVVLSGGRDRGLKAGTEFDVLESGAAILDPDTGDVIGHHASKLLGRVRITAVQDRYCEAQVIEGKPGDLKVGQRCRRVAS
jgi:curli biogenesis system outer membrane secretion channel CsgG